MTDAPYTLGEVLSHLEHALRTYPGFSWHGTTTACPNGRYIVDHDEATLYLDNRLTGDETFRAFIDGCVEMEAASTYRGVDNRVRRLAS